MCVLRRGVAGHPPGAPSSAGDEKGGDVEEKLEQDTQRSEQGETDYLPFVLSSICWELPHYHHQNIVTTTTTAAIAVEVNHGGLAVTRPSAKHRPRTREAKFPTDHHADPVLSTPAT